jgi:hypothetical protein
MSVVGLRLFVGADVAWPPVGPRMGGYLELLTSSEGRGSCGATHARGSAEVA